MRIISNEELLAVAGGEVGNPNPNVWDAAATRDAGQNSWGESVPGGLEFKAYAMASAAADAAAYNRCMQENSKPTISNQVASGIEAVGMGLGASILFGPAIGAAVVTVTYNAMNAAAVKSNKAGCDSADFN